MFSIEKIQNYIDQLATENHCPQCDGSDFTVLEADCGEISVLVKVICGNCGWIQTGKIANEKLDCTISHPTLGRRNQGVSRSRVCSRGRGI